MKLLVIIMALFVSMDSFIIFDFTTQSDISHWSVVDDVVMGGKSSSSFETNTEGYGVFAGRVSLKNNGGFSSLRYRCNRIMIDEHTHIIIKLQGDGKAYQLRIKSNAGDYYSYTSSFVTSGGWQEIVIPLKDMSPTYRGRTLDMPNFSNNYIEEIAILIGNKKEESFTLMIDKIELN